MRRHLIVLLSYSRSGKRTLGHSGQPEQTPLFALYKLKWLCSVKWTPEVFLFILVLRYTLDLSDIQMVVCNVKENWSEVASKPFLTSDAHVVEKFTISIQLERWEIILSGQNTYKLVGASSLA